jgi:nucleotide-binding universal stress UspA family protein
MYHDVLVPTDGSEGTSAAVDHAVDIATTYGATLHTLYVVSPTVGPDAGVTGILDALQEVGERAIDEVVERADAAGVGTVEGSVARGTPHRAILDYVDENDVDLVVMGTHGRTGIDRYLIGSVTEKVVRLSDVPVMTVRMPPESAGSADEAGSE